MEKRGLANSKQITTHGQDGPFLGTEESKLHSSDVSHSGSEVYSVSFCSFRGFVFGMLAIKLRPHESWLLEAFRLGGTYFSQLNTGVKHV
jgi:hypothetical protein